MRRAVIRTSLIAAAITGAGIATALPAAAYDGTGPNGQLVSYIDGTLITCGYLNNGVYACTFYWEHATVTQTANGETIVVQTASQR